MSDIFISYASEDRACVAPLADALSGQGWSVWWDHSINAGRHFDEVIEAELAAARVVIVAWSQASVESRWVRAEAQEGLDHNKLIPVYLDEISPPLIFRSLQAVSLVDWDGNKTTRDFTRLVADIGCLLGPAIPDRTSGKQAESHATAQRPGARRAGPLQWIGATAGVLLAVGIAGYVYLQQGEDLTERVTPTPEPETSMARPALSVFRDSLPDRSAGPEMVVIPAGEFRMGDLQGNEHANERPARRVHIAEPFAIGKYEVTYEEYLHFATATGRPPPYDEDWGRGRRPVIDVSWEDARAYARWLGEQTGAPYRLPSEAEWEYATRAGSESAYWWGDEAGNNHANCSDCGSRWDAVQTAPAGSFAPNHYGLHDAAGNVSEWVQDCYFDSYEGASEDSSAQAQQDCERRVVRNGDWNTRPEKIRSAARAWLKPLIRNNSTGFRVARDLPVPENSR
jgi:formylglycine-generating enzyme required for sulfatase activity